MPVADGNAKKKAINIIFTQTIPMLTPGFIPNSPRMDFEFLPSMSTAIPNSQISKYSNSVSNEN